MRKLLFVLGTLLVFQQAVVSQSLERSRVMYFNTVIEPFELNQIDTNVFVFSCKDNRKYNRVLRGNYPSIGITDSVFSRVDTFHFYSRVFKAYYKIASNRRYKHIWQAWDDYDSANNRWLQCYRRVNLRGQVLADKVYPWRGTITTTLDGTERLLPTNDNGCIAVGHRRATIGGIMMRPWSAQRIDSSGRSVWSRDYLFNFGYGEMTYQAYLPNGRLYISGFNGPNVVGVEIDTATGLVIRSRILWTRRGSIQLGTGVAIPNRAGGYMIQASDMTSLSVDSNRHTVFLDSSLRVIPTSQNVYNQSRFVYFAPTRDSSYIRWGVPGFSSATHFYQKFTADGRPTRIFILNQMDTSAGYVEPIDICSSWSGAAYLIGRSTRQGRTGTYFAKISDWGVPYLSAVPPFGPAPVDTMVVSARPMLAHQVLPQVYPSPSRGQVSISQAGILQLLDAQGRLIHQSTTLPDTAQDLTHLPAGLYVYRLTTPTRTYHGRWVKE